MNNLTMVGRVATDPELRFIPGSGTAAVNFQLAVDRPFSKNKTDFFRVVGFGPTAELIAGNTGKGKRIAVNGYLQTRSYLNSRQERRYVTEIIVRSVDIIEWVNRNQNTQSNAGAVENEGINDFNLVEDDDIPF